MRHPNTHTHGRTSGIVIQSVFEMDSMITRYYAGNARLNKLNEIPLNEVRPRRFVHMIFLFGPDQQHRSLTRSTQNENSFCRHNTKIASTHKRTHTRKHLYRLCISDIYFVIGKPWHMYESSVPKHNAPISSSYFKYYEIRNLARFALISTPCARSYRLTDGQQNYHSIIGLRSQ